MLLYKHATLSDQDKGRSELQFSGPNIYYHRRHFLCEQVIWKVSVNNISKNLQCGFWYAVLDTTCT